jgi:DNA-binding response OmpR family regulator
VTRCPASREDRVSGLDPGADDYLAEPFHFPELVLRVRALARRQPAAQLRILRAAGLELDAQQHAATRNGRRLELSVKESGVLEALMRAAPAFLSAENLVEQAWDEHADPSPTPSSSPSAGYAANPASGCATASVTQPPVRSEAIFPNGRWFN